MSANKDGSCHRRESILEAAARLFQHYGFSKTSVADIARQAGVGVGSVYLEFPGKDAIIEALSEKRYHQVLVAMREAMAQPIPHAQRLTAALDARTRSYLQQAQRGAHAPELIHCGCAGTLAAHQRFLEAEAQLLAELLREGQAAGDLRLGDPDAAARGLQAAYALTTPPAVFKFGQEKVEGLMANLHELVVYGLLKR